MKPTILSILRWVQTSTDSYVEVAELGLPNQGNGVLFSLDNLPANVIRGPYRLIVDVRGIIWPIFDVADQPLRYYHTIDSAKNEANFIAVALRKYCRLSSDGLKI